MDVLQYFIQPTYTDKHTTRSCPLATPEPLNQPQTSVKVRRSSGAPAGCHEAPSRQHRDLSGTHLLSQPICTAPPRRHTGCNRCTDKSNTSADKERGILVPSFSVRGALQLPAQDAGSLSAQTCWLRTWFRGVRCTVIPRAPCDRTGSRTGGLSSASFVIPPPPSHRKCEAVPAGRRRGKPRRSPRGDPAGTGRAERRGDRGHGLAGGTRVERTAPLQRPSPGSPLPQPRRTDDLRGPAGGPRRRLQGPGRHRRSEKAQGGEEGDPPHPAEPAPSPQPCPSAARQLTASPRAAAPRAALCMGSARRDRPRGRGARRDGR